MHNEFQVHVITHSICKGNEHLLEELDTILKSGGEGLVANNPDALHATGWTQSVLKIKVSHIAQNLISSAIWRHWSKAVGDSTDWSLVPTVCSAITELILIRHNGLTVTVRCFLSVLEDPPPPGAIITVKHTGYNASGKYNAFSAMLKNCSNQISQMLGRLQHPEFWRERRDVTWEEQKQIEEKKPFLVEWKFHEYLPVKGAAWANKENHKSFFDLLGRELSLQQPSDWYKLTKQDVYKYGGRGLLQKCYDNSVVKVNFNKIFNWTFWRLYNIFFQNMNGFLGNLTNLLQLDFGWTLKCTSNSPVCL